LLLKDSAEYLIAIKRLAMKKKRQIQEVVDLQTPDGRAIRLGLIVRPIVDVHGKVSGVIGVFFDPL
jgi:PAS domain-containing protein